MTLQVVILPYCRYPWRKVALRYLLLCCLSLFLSSPLSFSHSLCLLSTSIILTPTLTLSLSLSLLPTTRYTQSTIQSSCTQTHNLLHTHFLLLSFSFFLSSFIFFFFFLFSSSAAATAATTKCNNKRSEKTSAIFFSCVHFPA